MAWFECATFLGVLDALLGLPLSNAKACEALAARPGLLPFGLGRLLPIVNDLLIIASSIEGYSSNAG
jgi:hypothetical protein